MKKTSQSLAVVDAHFHLDLCSSPEAVAETIVAQRLHTIAVTNAPSVFHFTEALARQKENLHAAAGLHPELVESHGHETSLLWQLLDRTRYVGEVGLDYVSASPSVRRKQRRIFSEILARCAEYGDKILTVHSRRATDDVIDAVGDHFGGNVVLHWFSGSQKQLRRAIASGFWFSVNPAMATSNSGRRLIARMPRNRVLTESDGPFIKMAGRPAMPADTAEVVAVLADLWGCPGADARQTIETNFMGLLGATVGNRL